LPSLIHKRVIKVLYLIESPPAGGSKSMAPIDVSAILYNPCIKVKGRHLDASSSRPRGYFATSSRCFWMISSISRRVRGLSATPANPFDLADDLPRREVRRGGEKQLILWHRTLQSLLYTQTIKKSRASLRWDALCEAPERLELASQTFLHVELEPAGLILGVRNRFHHEEPS